MRMLSRAITAAVLAGVAGLVGCVGERGRVDVRQVEAAIGRVEQRRVVAASSEPWSSYPRLSALDSPSTAAGPGAVSDSDAQTVGRKAQLWRDIKAAPRSLWDDTKRTFTDRGNLTILLIGGGVSAGMRPELDDEVEDAYDRSHAMGKDYNDVVGALGNPATHFALAGGWYLTGLLAEDDRTREVGKTLVSALAINGVTTEMLKLATGTHSPNGESWAWPSGHTSSTMCAAAVLDETYGPWVGVPMYALAGLVAFERIDDGEHHLSDVVFGAALGWVVGHSVAIGHQPELLGGEIYPYMDPISGASGLAWVKTFK